MAVNGRMKTAMRFEVPYKDDGIIVYVPSDDLDDHGFPTDYGLFLIDEVIDWCKANGCMAPLMQVIEWDKGCQDFPGIVELEFSDDSSAMLFKFKWL